MIRANTEWGGGGGGGGGGTCLYNKWLTNTQHSGIRLQGDWGSKSPWEAQRVTKLRPPFLQLLKKLVLVQNELFVGRNPVKIEQTCKGKILLKNVVRCIRNAT